MLTISNKNSADMFNKRKANKISWKKIYEQETYHRHNKFKGEQRETSTAEIKRSRGDE